MKRCLSALIVVMMIAGSIVQPAHAQRRDPAPARLWKPIDAAMLRLERNEQTRLNEVQARKTVKSWSLVALDPVLLQTSPSIELQLPRGSLVVDAQRTEQTEVDSKKTFNWYGRGAEALPYALFSVGESGAVGTIHTLDGVYELYPFKGPTHILVEVDLDALPDDAPAELESPEAPDVGGHETHPFEMGATAHEDQTDELAPSLSSDDSIPEVAADTGAEITVLVAYTTQVKNQFGDGNLFAQLAVNQTNTIYMNSGISTRLRLVHTYETSYVNPALTLGVDHDRFTSATDGILDDVHARRNYAGADIAILLTVSGEGDGLCGRAWLPATATYAFAAVRYDCALSIQTFAHEVGHLQGARHNPEADPSTTPYAYGHGFVFKGITPAGQSQEWRTTMALQTNGCTCPRIPYFSTPTRTYNGVVLGTAATHDNARVINQTAATVANFRTNARVNLAYGKIGAVSQSSTYDLSAADKAIDASRETITHTNYDVNAWWQINLGSVQYIDAIDIWNRVDAYPERLSFFYVFVSDTPFTSTSLDVTKKQFGVSGYYVNGQAPNRTNMPIQRTGQYVRIQLTRTNHLSLGEVEIWNTPAPATTNAALNRDFATSQSSTYSGLDAGNAVDGNTNGNWATNTGTIARTNSQLEAWWQVDLGGVRAIDTVDIWNRVDAEQERLSNFYVLVSDVPFINGTLTQVRNQFGVSSFYLSSVAPIRTSVPIRRHGRYVRIQLTKTDFLTLSEVQVWANTTTPPTPPNLALNKLARQSSTDDLIAGNAVNGDTYGNWATNTGTMSRTQNQIRPWWEVDLGGAYPIDSIDIWNRLDANQALLSSAYVYVSDLPFPNYTVNSPVADTLNQPGVSSYLIPGAAGNRTTVPIKRVGRYVRIQLTSTTATQLILAEVQVRGWQASP